MKNAVKWILCIYVAFVFIQSLFFKFTDAYETIHIFSTLGAWSGFEWFSDYGAYGVGTVELIAAIMLFFSSSRLYGAAIASGVMMGAVFFHLFTPLGIAMPEFDEMGNVVGDDGGLLFYNACGVLAVSLIVTAMEFFGTDNAIKRVLFRSS
ncbi:membrane protein [Endozoicomonas montiporae]|uniref:Methylamine utilization protein MauE n=2 Tax=Endozoicomonas montiporae TaxID=1027273 RepID=A0A081N2J9_9GAMM|nr:MauE/DoxX family redox-associated membrane protein [Endozoicomonas montiporae]AMO54797.1 membrane protein [Endozoicomonas montiporae CL-33]KEQ12672.1 membrane protein [Endozoicomonas montiporae]